MSTPSTTIPLSQLIDGIATVECKSLAEYHQNFSSLTNYPHWIYRGQRDPHWKLEASLARALDGYSNPDEIATTHLENFKLASRGRRGSNPPKLKSSNEWWALGQHHGLETPLLDWTTSPYVALYFALNDSRHQSSTDAVAVFGIHRIRVEERVLKLPDDEEAEEYYHPDFPPKKDEVNFFQPQMDENARLVAQAGLFSRSPLSINLEDWVKKYFEGESKRAVLLKFLVSIQDREEALRVLNLMNINHSTLFPDLYGAGRHCTALLKRELKGRFNVKDVLDME